MCAAKYARNNNPTAPVILCVQSKRIGLVKTRIRTAPANADRTNLSKKIDTANCTELLNTWEAADHWRWVRPLHGRRNAVGRGKRRNKKIKLEAVSKLGAKPEF